MLALAGRLGVSCCLRRAGSARVPLVSGTSRVPGEDASADEVIAGLRAANSRLRALASERCEAAGIALRVPRPGLCTDNGAMVAALGSSIVRSGRPPSPLDLPADSSLPVTEVLVG